MDFPEDATLEKIKTPQLSIEINTVSADFNRNATVKETSSESPQIQSVGPNNNFNCHFKNYCSFCHRNTLLFPLVIVDTIVAKNLNFIQNHLLVPFINIIKHPPVIIVTTLHVVVAEVVVIIIESSFENLDLNLVTLFAQTVAQSIMTNTPLIFFLHSMTVIDLALINITITFSV